MTGKRKCRVEGCALPARSYGVCDIHITWETFDNPTNKKFFKCTWSGCLQPAKEQGYCPAHFIRWREQVLERHSAKAHASTTKDDESEAEKAFRLVFGNKN